MANRRKFSSAFKAQVALEALKERQSLAELSQRFEVSQVVISRWKSEFIKLTQGVFDDKHLSKNDGPSPEINALRAKVGQLTMERDFLEDACRRTGLNVK
ncbi:MAG: transposase [Anaerovoracaceae bacterium]